LAPSVALEGLEPVAGRSAKIAEDPRLIEKAQFSQRSRLHFGGQSVASPARPNNLGLRIGEARYHADV